jgi:hypothetical protein
MSTMLATTIFIFILSNIPGIVVNVLFLTTKEVNGEMVSVAYIFLMLNHSVNPFVYFLYSDIVRKRLRVFKICTCFRN